MKPAVDLFTGGGARFDGTGRYRYLLWRVWARGPRVLFILLNPSTADAEFDDPTVAKCARWARAWGFGGFVVCNAFARRSTDPARLYDADDPIGPDNNRIILEAAGEAALVVCGWGHHAALHDRGHTLAALLQRHGHVLHALHLTKAGHPGHPLYLPARTKPRAWPGYPGVGA